MSCLVESQLPRLPQSASLEGYAEYPVEYAEYAEYPVAYVEGRTARNPSNQRADHATVLAVLSPVTKGNSHLRQSHWCDNSQLTHRHSHADRAAVLCPVVHRSTRNMACNAPHTTRNMACNAPHTTRNMAYNAPHTTRNMACNAPHTTPNMACNAPHAHTPRRPILQRHADVHEPAPSGIIHAFTQHGGRERSMLRALRALIQHGLGGALQHSSSAAHCLPAERLVGSVASLPAATAQEPMHSERKGTCSSAVGNCTVAPSMSECMPVWPGTARNSHIPRPHDSMSLPISKCTACARHPATQERSAPRRHAAFAVVTQGTTPIVPSGAISHTARSTEATHPSLVFEPSPWTAGFGTGRRGASWAAGRAAGRGPVPAFG
jgi:hypothetical protein